MTRHKREQELRNLMYGHYFELAEQYLHAAELPPGTTLPMGLLVSQMIQVILDKEFPFDTAHIKAPPELAGASRIDRQIWSNSGGGNSPKVSLAHYTRSLCRR